jgi:hypothetical protein
VWQEVTTLSKITDMVVILGLWVVHDGGDGGKVYWQLGLAAFGLAAQTGGVWTVGSDWRRLNCRLGLAAFGLSARTCSVWIVGSDWRLGRVDLD